MSSSTSMPPPPTPLAPRRTRVNSNHRSPPLSPPYSPNSSSSCVLRKMSLSKGATFHVPSSPPTEDDPSLSIRHLTRRSPTSSHSSLMSLISDKKDVAAQSIQDFEQTFSGARGSRRSSHRRSSDDFARQVRLYKNTSSPVDEGLGSSIGAASDKGLERNFERALSFKDSALGSSMGDGSVKLRYNSEEDGLSAQDLIQGTDESDTSPLRTRTTRQQGNRSSKSTNSTVRSAVTQSIAPQPSHQPSHQPRLSKFARQRLAKNILDPILQEERFELFHPLVSSLGSKSDNTIRCLRDLEQSLIFQPLVSNIPDPTSEIEAYHLWLLAQTLAVSQHLYRTFGEFSIQLVLDTYQHLSESEQRRPADRPYDNGYFLDLVQQVGQLAASVGRAREAKNDRENLNDTEEQDEMAYSPEDEITLEGGLGETGEIAELVRWKNGKGISLRTNQPYEPLLGIKRQHSNESLDDSVARSMARRKKGEIPKIIELKCSDSSCDKIFNRRCDLAKHEKTHSRPFKCPEASCKYHHEGLPTEKEMQRHVNDKHDPNPHYFCCTFCAFKTKRESNCKQHMEKKHDWTYERVKGTGKVIRTPGQTPQTPSMDYSPSPAPSTRNWGDDASSVSGSLAGSVMHTPQEQAPLMDFNAFPTPYSGSLFPRQPSQFVQATQDFGFETAMQAPAYATQSSYRPFVSPISTTPAVPQFGRSPITPAYSTITSSYDQSPHMERMNFNIDYTSPATYNGLPTPSSNYLQPHSRNPSISYESPVAHGQPEESFMDEGMGMDGMTTDAFVTHSQLPMEDFSLFEAGPSGFNSVAGPSTAPGTTLFPEMDKQYQDGDYYYDDQMGGLEDYLDFDPAGI